MTLIDRIRKGRESQAKLGKITIKIRRPTDMDALELSYSSTREAVLGVCRFVVDWSEVTELDLVPGGTAEKVPFDQELFQEWIQDQPQHWETLITLVRNSYQDYRKKTEASAKN